MACLYDDTDSKDWALIVGHTPQWVESRSHALCVNVL